MRSILQNIYERGAAIASTFRKRWLKKARANLLPRLLFVLIRDIPARLRPGPRAVIHTCQLSLEYEDCAALLEQADYVFSLRLAFGQELAVRASLAACDPRGVELTLFVNSRSFREALLLRYRAAHIERQLANIAARVLMQVWSGQHRAHAFPTRIFPGDQWLREYYVSLNPASFPTPGWWPEPPAWLQQWARRWLPEETLAPLRLHAAWQEHQSSEFRRRRRILLLPLRGKRQELEAILPPPFRARWRNPAQTPAARAEIRLYVRIFLDGGEIVPPDPDKARSSYNYSADSSIERGAESAVYMELLCPAMVHADSNRTRGWVPLLACRIPLNRPALPWDRLTASYRVRTDGIRFCLGDRKRRLLGEALYAPVRGTGRGDRLPRLVRVPTTIMIQSPQTLEVHLLRESYDAPVNRIYLMRQLPGQAPTLSDYLGRRLGVALETETAGWLVSYADVRTHSERRVPLRECHYRNLEENIPDLAGYARNSGDSGRA